VNHQAYAVAALCVGKRPGCQLIRRLGGLQNQSVCFGEERNLSPAKIGILDCPGCSLVSILSALSWL
jgi:hypothetical protein